LLLITHHRPTNIIFINNIHYIRPSILELWYF
jgi:Holliday junction resolvasome RuvABC ATP-dependent DNA helicase subunit